MNRYRYTYNIAKIRLKYHYKLIRIYSKMYQKLIRLNIAHVIIKIAFLVSKDAKDAIESRMH